MKKRATVRKILSLGAVALAFSATSVLAQPVVQEVESFPRALDSYAGLLRAAIVPTAIVFTMFFLTR